MSNIGGFDMYGMLINHYESCGRCHSHPCQCPEPEPPPAEERVKRVIDAWCASYGSWLAHDESRPEGFHIVSVMFPDEHEVGDIGRFRTTIETETAFALKHQAARIAELQERLARETRARREAERGRP